MVYAKKLFQDFNFKIKFFNFLKFVLRREFIFSHAFMSVIIFFLTLSSVFFYLSKYRAVEAYDAWFNELWSVRQKIVVVNSASADATNFVVKASFPGADLVSTSLLKSDCTDFRVVDKDLNLLDYYIDPESCTSASASIFFKIPTLNSKSSSTFYIYYGNQNATVATVAQTSLFTNTIPNLKAFYTFDNLIGNTVIDETGVNNGTLINSMLTYPDGTPINNNNTFPEGYSGKGFYFNGTSVYLETPIRFSSNFSNAFSLISFIKPEGSRANGYQFVGETMGKMFNFENIKKTGTTCNAAEYTESDGPAECLSNGLLYKPTAVTQKKTGVYSYFYDFYEGKLTRPSLAVSFNGTSQFLVNNNPVNFIPFTENPNFDFGFFMRIKPYGNSGDVRTIMSYGNTEPSNTATEKSLSLDYSVCDDGSIKFILDYNNARVPAQTLATPCLNAFKLSNKISTSAGTFSVYPNTNTWINIGVAQFNSIRAIYVNGVRVASDAQPNVFIQRENNPIFFAKPSNSDKSFFKGEIDEFNFFGQDQGVFTSLHYTNGVLNTTVDQVMANVSKKAYTIFGNNNNNFYQAGFSNHANARYNTATAISSYNYNSNTSTVNDFFQQYGRDVDSLNSNSSFISTTFDIFDGSWYLYKSDFDNNRNSITTSYVKGVTTIAYSNVYNSVNISGNLVVGAFVSSNPDTATFPSEFYFGGMDDVFIYSATLSSTQFNLHSAPYNAYGSVNKSLWQDLNSNLVSSGSRLINFSQNFSPELQNRSVRWYDENYNFRAKIVVSSIPALTIPDFQIQFTLNTSTPINSQKMNSDCSGIIVVDEFNRKLPFWIEGCNKAASEFYVKMNPNTGYNYDIKGASVQNIFVYYGNPRSIELTYPVDQVFDATVPGLHIAYTFDDDSATAAFDKSGNGINLRWVSRTNSTAGAFGNSPYFNGSTNYGSGPLTRAEIASWDGISILSWNKNQSPKNDNKSRFIFSQIPNAFQGFNYGFEFVTPNYFHSVGLYATNSVLKGTLSEWPDTTNYQHTAYTWKYGSNNSMSLYYNGNFSNSIANGTAFLSFPNTQGVFTFGSRSKIADFWSGAIDELRIFDRQLSSYEIAEYSINTTIGSSIFDLSINTCNQVNNYCIKSFVTPSFAGTDLLGKYNSNVIYTTFAEEKFVTPILYFKFNEGSGVLVKDSSNNYSNSFLGQIRALTHPSGEDPAFVSADKCIEGGCLYFDGINDLVEAQTIPNPNAAAIGATANTDTRVFNSDYSYSFWIKPLTNQGNIQNIVSFENQGTTGRAGYTLHLNSNMQIVSFGSSGTTYISSSAQALPINKWSHVTFNYSNSSKANSFYVNGELSNVTTNTVDNDFNTTKVYFGGSEYSLNTTTRYFHGYLDEFKMYNKVLSTDDIKDNYRKGLNNLNYNLTADASNINNFNLMAYYRFDEEGRSLGFDQTDLMGEGGYSNLTQVNAAGLFSNSFVVPGGTTYFSLPYSNLTNLIKNGAYSVWVKISSTTASDAIILSKSGTGSMSVKYKYLTQKYEGNICGTTLLTGNTFQTGSFDNLVLTSNSNKAKLFVNSKLEAEEYCFNNYIGDSVNLNSIRVGGDGTNTSVNGLIDEFKIYENYFSNNQVKLLFDLAPSYVSIGANPVAFYKLDELDGTTTASDSSGNSNTLGMFASANNLNSWDTYGKIGGSYDFTTNAASTRNMLTKATSTMTTGRTQPYSLGTWVAFQSKPNFGFYTVGFDSTLISVGGVNPPAANTFVNLAYSPNSSRFLLTKHYSNNIEAEKQGFSSPYITLTLPYNKTVWNHVTATFDGTYRRSYMNGNLVAVDTGAVTTNSISTSMITLGMVGNQVNVSFQLLGNLDEAKIYNYARSQEQVQNDMRNMSRNGFSGIDYSSMRSNQITSIVRSSSEPNIYPIFDAKFDSVFTNNSIVYRNSANTLSLASTNVSYSPAGVRGGAALIGSGDSLSFGNASQLNFDDADFAISFFIKQDSVSSTDFTIASATNFVIRKVNNAINFSNPTISITSTSTIGNSNFTHIVLQKTNTEKVYSLYINKTLEASKYSSDVVNYSDLSFVGNSSVSYLLDELKIFDSEISQNEISNLYIGGHASKIGKQDTSSMPSYEFKFETSDGSVYSSGLSSASALVNDVTERGLTGNGISSDNTAIKSLSLTPLINLSSIGAVSFWFKTSSGEDDTFLLKTKTPVSGNGLNIKLNSSSCSNSISVLGASSNCFQNNFTNGSLIINDNSWKHVNLNFNNGSYNFYLDGVMIGSGTYAPTSYSELVLFEYTGVSDDLRLYDYERSPTQVASEYSANKPYIYLKMDECSGNKLYNSSLNLYEPLQGIQNGTRFDSGPFNNTGFNLTKASGNLIFGNCTTLENSNFYLGGTGKYNSSFYFDGSVWAEGNDYHAYSLNQGTQASVSFWINIDTNPTQTATIFGPSLDASRGHKIEYNNRSIILKRNDNGISMGTILTSVSTIPTRTWTHVTLTSDGNNYKLYFNGNLDNSASGYSAVSNTCTGFPEVTCANLPAVIGKSFKGMLDEFKIYNFPLTQSQIKIDMNQNAGVRID